MNGVGTNPGYYPRLKVTPLIRSIMAVQCVAAAFMFGTLLSYTTPIGEILIRGGLIYMFMVMWIAIVVLTASAAYTGWDILVRVSSAVCSVMYWMSLASIITDSLPWVQQFFTATLCVMFGVLYGVVAAAPPLQVLPPPVGGIGHTLAVHE